MAGKPVTPPGVTSSLVCSPVRAQTFPMSPTSPKTCNHDRGPGTTVCLRCRHDEWQASQRRRQQMLMRFLALGFVVAIVGIAGLGAASAWRERSASAVTDSVAGSVTLKQEGRSTGRPTRLLAPTPSVAASTRPATVASAPEPVSAPVPAAPSASSRGSVLGQGKTMLTDSIFAIRSGDSVTVNFDVQGNRTQRADKFERMLRTTLPMVYGRLATATFDEVPTGSFLPSRDVVGELHEHGMQLTLDNGVRISVRPQTRGSRDGPLVVAYLTVLER